MTIMILWYFTDLRGGQRRQETSGRNGIRTERAA